MAVAERGPILALAGIAVLAVALRIPFIWAGVGPDEGGYAFVGHEWAHGVGIYSQVWVDRPQGLLLLFRAITDVAYAPWAIRLAAALLGGALAVVVGTIGWMLRGRATGLLAAAIFAIVGIAPNLEGFTLNAELAAALPAAAAVACAIRWHAVGRRRWLVAAGVFGATAVLMKQSGFDGLAIALLVALVARAPRTERAKRVGAVVAGAAVPLGAAAIHGAVIGWKKYWFAIYGLRAQDTLTSGVGDRLHRLGQVMPKLTEDILGLGLIALLGAALLARRRGRLWLLAPAWLAVALVGVNLGGLYWPHYFVQLIAPLVLLAAVAVATLSPRMPVLAVAAACIAVAPVAITLVHLATTSASTRTAEVRYLAGYEKERRLARFVRDHSVPTDTIYVVGSRADLYFLADRRPPIPFLWSHSGLKTAQAKDAVLRALGERGGPKLVIAWRQPSDVDKSGSLSQVLSRRYRFLWRPTTTGPKPLPAVLIARDARPGPGVPYTTRHPIAIDPGGD